MPKGRLLDMQTVSPGVGVVGRLKIGEKRLGKNGKEYPAALDYFRVDAPENYAKMFREAYGEKPRTLQITFISDDVTHACNLQYELRGDSGKLYAKGDGKNFAVFNVDHWVFLPEEKIIEKHGSIQAFKDAAKQHCNSSKGWEPRLTLRFMLPKIKGLIGEWQLSTKGLESSIKQIVGVFDQVLNSAGTVKMLPFDLSVTLAKGDTHGAARQFPVLQLIANASIENLNIIREAIDRGSDPWRAGLLTDERILLLDQNPGQ